MWQYKVSILLVAIYLATGLDGTLQQITFHQWWSCTPGGRTLTVTGTTGGLRHTWVGLESPSIAVVGAWRVHLEMHPDSENSGYISSYTWNAKPPTGICVDKADYTRTEMFEFVNVVRFGPDDMTTSHITIFGPNRFPDHPEAFEYSQDAGNVPDISMSAVIIFSNTTWIVHEGRNFTGSALCLVPDDANYDDFTYNYVDFLVGSARKDIENECETNSMNKVLLSQSKSK